MNFEFLMPILIQLCSVIVSGCLVLALYVYWSARRFPNLTRHESEKYFWSGKERKKFPWALSEEAEVDLSVIVPAYNEEKRLPLMLDEALAFLEARRAENNKYTYEIIVVDDGSKDKTTQVAQGYSEEHSAERVRVLTLAKNKGKGGAVRMGMLSARGGWLLFADADGATHFPDIHKLEQELRSIEEWKDDMAVVCGSRAHLEEESIAKRSLFRTILMKGFHFLVAITCVRGIRDTQCGFKLMTREAARLLFSNMHIERWAFDIDLLYLARHFQAPIREVAVKWTEIDGSTLSPLRSSLQMGRDLIRIRFLYMTRAWRIRSAQQLERKCD